MTNSRLRDLTIGHAAGRHLGDEYFPFTGQSAGLIHDIRPVAEIVSTMLAQARTALSSAAITPLLPS